MFRDRCADDARTLYPGLKLPMDILFYSSFFMEQDVKCCGHTQTARYWQCFLLQIIPAVHPAYKCGAFPGVSVDESVYRNYKELEL